MVIGNSAYEKAGPLANPKNDAVDVATALRALGFQIIDGLDLSKVDMERKIRSFRSE